MTDIYKQIHTRLEAGKASRLLSRYSKQGIRRTLIEEDRPAAEGGLTFEAADDTLTLSEGFAPRPRLVILGGGHIAAPLTTFAKRLGFDIWLFDDRPGFANPAGFPDAHTVICDNFTNMSTRLQFTPYDYVTILTRGHKHDIFCLEALLNASELPQYIGMIGSKRRIAIVKNEVASRITHPERLEQLHAPIGLPIGSVTPEEIALSIMAEIVAHKRLGKDGKRAKKPQEGCIDPDLLHWLAHRSEEQAALVTIVHTSGSTPREVGAKMAVTAEGNIFGSIGGGCAEADVITRARDVIDQGNHLLHTIDLADTAEEDGMVCGGRMQVLIEAL